MNTAINEAAELITESPQRPVLRSLESVVDRCKNARGMDAKLMHVAGDHAALILETNRNKRED